MHARIDNSVVRLLTRTGLDWTGKYQAIAAALRTLPAAQACLDGEFYRVQPDGITSFALIQNAPNGRAVPTSSTSSSTCSTWTVGT